ncbi:auxin-responsive protein [Salix suchowensis]|nr:auxin-responsive protein [Salix suchowensis]
MQGGFFGGGSGGSVCMSTVSMEDNVVMSSEDSSSPDEVNLNWVLGSGPRGCQQYARILTAKDLPSKVSVSSSSSTTSSSSTLSRAIATAGTKRTADSVAASNGVASQVVGWPPIRSHRMHIMVNQAKSQVTEEFSSMNKHKNAVEEKVGNKNINTDNTKARTSLFVKVNMDGTLIGRKVDLNAHGCYETLAQALENMFLRTTTTVNMTRLSTPEHKNMIDAKRHSQLLGGSSEFVLTYEDKDGDWMLVGDVPWGMFTTSVKRLRIMRTSEATGLGK